MASKRTLKPVDLNFDEPGKDLSRLFAASLATEPDVHQAEMVALDRLLDNPYQPRLHMHDDTLEALSQVIAGQGFQGVLVARPHPGRRGHYQLAVGHRRREAARRSGLSALPVIVRDLTDEEMVTIAITENIQRDDLTPLEEGRIYLLMHDEMGYKLEQISREVGKTLGYVYNRVRVAKAPPDVQAFVQEKPDSLRAVANLIKVKSESERGMIMDALKHNTMTTDDIPIFVKELHLHLKDDETMPLLPPEPPQDEIYPWTIASELADEQRAKDGPAHMGDIPAPQIEAATAPAEPITQSQLPRREESTVLVNGTPVQIERDAEGHLDFGWKKREPLSQERLEEITRLRTRRSKLSRALSMLQTYDDLLDDQAAPTTEERLELATVAVLADRLCERFGIEKGA